MIDWNRPLVSHAGKPLKIDGNLFVKHADGVSFFHNADGTIVGISADALKRYTLHNRPWRVGDPVVSAHSNNEGVVDRISSYPGDAFPILVRFDAGDKSWMPANGIRYDYSRASKPEEYPHGYDFTSMYSVCWSDGTTANKKNPHAELEALIADALETHEASKRTGDDALADDIAAHLYAYRGNRDGPTMPVARSIIAMVRKHDAANQDADHFPDIKKMVRAEARREALEEAVTAAEGLRPAAGWSEQTADDWECGCLDAASAIRALINKDSAND